MAGSGAMSIGRWWSEPMVKRMRFQAEVLPYAVTRVLHYAVMEKDGWWMPIIKR